MFNIDKVLRDINEEIETKIGRLSRIEFEMQKRKRINKSINHLIKVKEALAKLLSFEEKK